MSKDIFHCCLNLGIISVFFRRFAANVMTNKTSLIYHYYWVLSSILTRRSVQNPVLNNSKTIGMYIK